MGSFKPLLPLGNTSVIEKSVRMFESAGINNINVVVGYKSNELLPILKPLKVNIIANNNYSEGMFSSVKAGIRIIEPSIEAFFFLPGDIPLVLPKTITALITAYRSNSAGIIYPCLNGERGHPPLISTAYRDTILSWDKEGGLRSLLQEYEADVLDIEVEDQGVLQDMDTPLDYQRVRESVSGYVIPSVHECHRLLDNWEVPEQVQRHCQTVAQVAEG
ncbi:hypothetical protein N752_28985 [Desulforamulus aquiferis]|nr:nucleotidyltransferase family protein [Desulforamulus aquiferis]RYD01614.1 hypothetical protein N752_28985 [Desulforamulus aquiferis]